MPSMKTYIMAVRGQAEKLKLVKARGEYQIICTKSKEDYVSKLESEIESFAPRSHHGSQPFSKPEPSLKK